MIVIGTPMDFRLGFGKFGEAQVVHIQDHPDQISAHASPAVGLGGDITTTLAALAEAPAKLATERGEWIARL